MISLWTTEHHKLIDNTRFFSLSMLLVDTVFYYRAGVIYYVLRCQRLPTSMPSWRSPWLGEMRPSLAS